ncbi:MAG: cation transporter [Candidatus Rokubacteria bacterium]|nr:cation transporter [Candidatus Rokubacteria bacterium]
MESTSVQRAGAAASGKTLQYVTIGWNTAEGVIAIAAGVAAGSIALVGFGLDSAIEVSASLAALWRLHRDHDEEAREAAEGRALRLIGLSFLALAAYVLWEAASTLLERQPPEHSIVGIVLASLSLVVMPVLAHVKRRIATRLESGALEAETRQTEICAWLSLILLVGLALNASLGWWWADPVAGIVMVPLIAREGIEAVRGKTCCCGGEGRQ